MKNVAFLFSGRGSLVHAVRRGISDAVADARLSVVITNNSQINRTSLRLADQTAFHVIDHREFSTREEHENAIATVIESAQIDVIVLGGYRRIFSDGFVKKYGSMIMNTHPSLLPAFPGDKAQQRALDAGVKVTGATLHFVNEQVDEGPIIAQGVVYIPDNIKVNDLREEIIKVEQGLIQEAIASFLDGEIELNGNKVTRKPRIQSQLFGAE